MHCRFLNEQQFRCGAKRDEMRRQWKGWAEREAKKRKKCENNFHSIHKWIKRGTTPHTNAPDGM